MKYWPIPRFEPFFNINIDICLPFVGKWELTCGCEWLGAGSWVLGLGVGGGC
jgi:hypothetical protein